MSNGPRSTFGIFFFFFNFINNNNVLSIVNIARNKINNSKRLILKTGYTFRKNPMCTTAVGIYFENDFFQQNAIFRSTIICTMHFINYLHTIITLMCQISTLYTCLFMYRHM